MIIGTAGCMAVASVLALASAPSSAAGGGGRTAIVAIVLPFFAVIPGLLPLGAEDWLLRIIPAAGVRAPAGLPAYQQVLGHYLPGTATTRSPGGRPAGAVPPGPRSRSPARLTCSAGGTREPRWNRRAPLRGGAVARPLAHCVPHPLAGFPDALHAEWTKLRTLAGTGWLLLAAAALTVAVGAAAAGAFTCCPAQAAAPRRRPARTPPRSASLACTSARRSSPCSASW